jgi:hypothetical protein
MEEPGELAPERPRARSSGALSRAELADRMLMQTRLATVSAM